MGRLWRETTHCVVCRGREFTYISSIFSLILCWVLLGLRERNAALTLRFFADLSRSSTVATSWGVKLRRRKIVFVETPSLLIA